MSKGESTKTVILDQAIKIASVQGLEGLTIGTLADSLKMSKSGLFAKFSSKENLQAQVLQAAGEMFRRSVIYPTLKAKPGVKRIQTAFHTWLTWSEANEIPGGCLFLSSSSEFDDRPGTVRETLVRFQNNWLKLLNQITEEAKATNEFKSKIKSEAFVQELWGIVLGYHFYNRLFLDLKAKDRANRSFTELIKRSLNEV